MGRVNVKTGVVLMKMGMFERCRTGFEYCAKVLVRGFCEVGHFSGSISVFSQFASVTKNTLTSFTPELG